MTTPITRLQQYHAGYPGAMPGGYPAPTYLAPSYPAPAPGYGQDQMAATIAALRSRIAELQQRIATASQPQPGYYPQPQPGYYPRPAYPGTTGVASLMQEMADNMQRSQWETEMRTRQLQQSVGQVSGQMANTVNQLGYSIQSIAQSFQGLFGRR